MKKGLSIALAIMMLLLTFTACGKKDGDEYIEVTDTNGEVVTDDSGEAVTSLVSKTEDDKTNKTDKTDKNNKDDKTEKTTSTTSSTNSAISGLEDLVNNDFNPNASKNDLLEEGTTVKKTNLYDDVIGDSIKTKKFTMSTKMVGESGEMPITFTMDNDRIASELTVSGITVKVIMQEGKAYIAFTSPSKIYYEIADESMSLEDMMPSTEEHTYVATTKVDGYTCEEYTTKSGVTTKYYFSGNKWVRYEYINGEEISILEISDFKPTVDNTLFSLTGYTKLDMNSLAGLGGLS